MPSLRPLAWRGVALLFAAACASADRTTSPVVVDPPDQPQQPQQPPPPPPPPVESPASLTVVGVVPPGEVGAALAAPVAVVLRTASGQPVAAAPVSFTVTAGGGTAASAGRTDSLGVAQATWTLGTVAGEQVLHVEGGGLALTVSTMARPAAPASLSVIAAPTAASTVGTTLPTPIQVRVVDRFGNVVPGVPIEFSTGPGARVESASAETDGSGVASAGRWTLGGTAGEQLLRIAVATRREVTATVAVQAAPGPLARLVVESGDGQRGRYDRAVEAPLVVRAIDAYANGIAGVPVSWATRNAAVTAHSAATDSAGRASAAVTLGDVIGPVVVTATSRGAPPVSLTVTTLGAVRVASGQWGTCELLSDGSAYCWGADANGTVHGSTPCSLGHVCLTRPESAVGRDHFTALTHGWGNVCGVRATDGRVVCWGNNANLQLGRGENVLRGDVGVTAEPVQLDLPFVDVDASESSVCGVARNGGTYCWGLNGVRSLGLGYAGRGAGQPGQDVPVPTRTLLSQSAVQIAVGELAGCALTAAGAAWCWGPIGGAWPEPMPTSYYLPTPLAGGLQFAQIAANGRDVMCGITTAGALVCWGSGYGAESLAGGPYSHPPVTLAPGVRFTRLGHGGGSMCAIAVDGRTYCWGSNSYGQLGDGSRAGHDAPTPVATNERFVSVSSSDTHTCAVNERGLTYCWGSNLYGQLGDGTLNDHLLPARVR